MWTVFQPDGDDPEGEARAIAALRRVQPPTNEIPVPVPVTAVLGRSERCVVALTGVRAYTGGVQLDVALRMRPDDENPVDEAGLFPYPGTDLASLPLFGIQLEDGRSASSVDAIDPGEVADDELLLQDTGSGGGGGSWDTGYWLTPCPSGPVDLVFAWRAGGVPETVTRVDGELFAAASARATVLWPPSLPEGGPPQPPAIDLPADSWFARHRRGPAGA